MRSSSFPRLGRTLAVGMLGCAALGTPDAEAQQAAYVGEVIFVAFSPCPFGWAEANGQMLPVTSNQALFSVIGTTYGGDGTTTFALPNVQGVVSAPATLTPEPGVSEQPLQPQLIKQQKVKKQAVKKQEIRQQGVEQPPTEDPAAGTPLLACIALEGVLPSETTANPPVEPTPEEPLPPTE
jgi:microcystin-dependent protein